MSVDVLPAGQKPGELALVGGLDLLAEPGEARSPQPPQDVRLAPLSGRPSREELSADDLTRPLQLAQSGARIDAVAVGQLPGGEGDVGGGIAPDQGDEGV